MDELTALGAGAIASLVAAGEVSRREVALAHLERIEAEEPRIGAFSARRVPEQVLAEASRADERSSDGRPRPLDGVPVVVKETFDVAGLASTEGVRARAANRAAADAIAPARLRAAGALILGKGKQPDFKSRWNTVSELHGVTRNPSDPSRTAGGSSGGDAAAVAAGFSAAGLGSDFGGSIRVPAAFCGVSGIRTSPGLIPDGAPAGASITAAMSSLGPIARAVDDLRLLVSVLADPPPGAPAGVPPRAPRRVARLCAQLGAVVDPALIERLDVTCAAFADAGYEVVEAEIPGGERLPDLFGELVGTDVLAPGSPARGGEMGVETRRYLETMFGARQLRSEAELDAARAELESLAATVAIWMEDHPLVVAPVAGMEAPRLDFDHALSPAGAARLFDRMRNATWVNLLGLPALALPNGIQVVGRRFAEAEVLAAAATVEDAAQPPATPPIQPVDTWKVEDR